MISTLLMVLMGVLALVVLVLVIFIIDTKKNNITLHLKEPVNNNFLYHKRKARVKKDNEGQELFKATKAINGKKYFPIPEDNKSTHLDAKGKKHVNGYISAHGEVVYSIDNNTNLFVDEEFIKEIQPFTSNQRALYINQERKAQEDAGKGWKQNIALIASGFVLVVILVISAVIFKQLYDGNKDVQEINLQITEKQLEIIDAYTSIDDGIQEIKAEISQQESEVIP